MHLRPQKVVAEQRLFLSILERVVSVYSEAEIRVLNAEKATLSTSERHFPKGTYNILVTLYPIVKDIVRYFFLLLFLFIRLYHLSYFQPGSACQNKISIAIK